MGTKINHKKPDRAMMRPDFVFQCIDFGSKHVTYIERQMENQTDKTTEQQRIKRLSKHVY